jgi:hypothetical protein
MRSLLREAALVGAPIDIFASWAILGVGRHSIIWCTPAQPEFVGFATFLLLLLSLASGDELDDG